MGRGIKSVIVWFTEANVHTYDSLNINQEPSEMEVSSYQKRLENIGWDESIAEERHRSSSRT